MALKVDDNFLRSVGLGKLPEAEKDLLLKQIYNTLEKRVGKLIMAKLTEAQLADFEQIIDANNQPLAQAWLTKNYPNYANVVAVQVRRLQAEISRDSKLILEKIKTLPTRDLNSRE